MTNKEKKASREFEREDEELKKKLGKDFHEGADVSVQSGRPETKPKNIKKQL
jgi:hypothetical protein